MTKLTITKANNGTTRDTARTLLRKSACANFFLSGVPSAAVIGPDGAV